jgi:hypothetical protein
MATLLITGRRTLLLTFVSVGATIAVLAMQLLQHDCRAGNLKLELQGLSAIEKPARPIFLTKLVTFSFSKLNFLLSVRSNKVTKPPGETNQTESVKFPSLNPTDSS